MLGVQTRKKMADSANQKDDVVWAGDGEKTNVHSSPGQAESMDVSTLLNSGSDTFFFLLFRFVCFLLSFIRFDQEPSTRFLLFARHF